MQRVDNSQFVIERLVIVKLEVLVGVDGLPVYSKQKVPVAPPGGFCVKLMLRVGVFGEVLDKGIIEGPELRQRIIS